MNTREAAAAIGCSIYHVRWMIRNGRLSATKKVSRHNQHEYEYDLERKEVERVKKIKYRSGKPRGKKGSV